jgi:hypothetical protein
MSVAFFLGGRQSARPVVTVAQQWERIVIPVVISHIAYCCWNSYSFYSLALPSPGWTPLLLMMLWYRADHPGLSRTGLPRGASSPTGLSHFQGLHHLEKPPADAPTPSPNRDFLFNPWSSTIQDLPHDACCIGAWAPALPVPGGLPPRLSILCLLAHQGYRNPFSALSGLRP